MKILGVGTGRVEVLHQNIKHRLCKMSQDSQRHILISLDFSFIFRYLIMVVHDALGCTLQTSVQLREK